MKKIKTIHIHTDYKFYKHIGRFKGDYFENVNVFILKEPFLNVTIERGTKVYKSSELDKVIELCNGFDLVVLHDLDYMKSKIVLSLPKSTVIAWRFFGYELYNKMSTEFISKETYEALFDKNKKLREKMRFHAKIIYNNTSIYGTKLHAFNKSISRLDYFFGLSKREYFFFKKHWPNLPRFINLTSFAYNLENSSVNLNRKKEKRTVVLGNSKSFYNNHLDLFKIVEKSDSHNLYVYKILFNYGAESPYTDHVRERIKDKKYYHLVENFISKEDFKCFYNDVSALVVNSYRQMAVGNIRLAIGNGVKVYLNHNNIIYKDLKSYGFNIYTIDQFEEDLNNEKLILSKEKSYENISLLNKLSEDYTSADFQEKLYNEILKGKTL